MTGVVYDRLALIDTSAVIALLDSQDQFHQQATAFFQQEEKDFIWCTVSTTAQELFTRVRYDKGLLPALRHFDFLRTNRFCLLAFAQDDEREARRLLEKYVDQTFSFHDALCAVIMLRSGIYRVFSFDKHFWTLGFQVMPGFTT